MGEIIGFLIVTGLFFGVILAASWLENNIEWASGNRSEELERQLRALPENSPDAKAL